MRNFYTDITEAIAFEAAAPTGYTLASGSLMENLWIAKYEERKEDGQNYYTKIQAGLYLSILDGTYTSSEVFDFEEYTSNAIASVISV